jgi:hypothetical protein
MAQQTKLKVVLRDGTEDVLKVGDKIIYVEGGHEFKCFGKVARLTPARAYLERGGYITKNGLVQGIGGSDARYISKKGVK